MERLLVGRVTVRCGRRARRYRNRMVQNGWLWLLDRALGLGQAITHIAVGDGTAEPQPGDTALGHEVARKAVSQLYRDVQTLVAEVMFDYADANFNWTEAGLFAGGTDALGTGTLIARALVSEAKDDKRTATVTWEIEVVPK